jgi:hypothetical protein
VKLTIVSLTTCLIANSVWAEPVLLPVKALHCEDYEVVRDTMVDYGELPLMTGSGTQSWNSKGRSGVLKYTMLFFTNQTSGTWTLLQLYDKTKTACVAASGTGWEPYIK